MPKFPAFRFGDLLLKAGTMVVLGAVAAGCSYDQRNHSDRVTFAAGNAVRANLERETVNPSKDSMYRVGGLGRNGIVIPDEESTEAAP
ncbi:hypothetical protein [Devosia sp.]|uniref:hypothetical protein n=1 Tax=Devosia sp. TaxID=1871048 RepID=UPI002FC757E8